MFSNIRTINDWRNIAELSLANREKIEMHRVFVDMDGVLVDFEGYVRDIEILQEAANRIKHNTLKPSYPSTRVKTVEGAYKNMLPILVSLEAVRSLIGMGWNVFLATKPPTSVVHAYSDKASWVFDHIPELKKKLIITPDKGLLGDVGDYLIDDRIHKANCGEFKGTLIEYKDGNEWPEILELFRSLAKTTNLRGGS